MIDVRQSLEWKKYQESLEWKVERIDAVNYAIRKIPVLGNIVKIQRPKQFDSKTISQLISKYKPFQIIIEPGLTSSTNGPIIHHVNDKLTQGLKLSKNPYLPTKTIHIDLTKSEKELLSEMHYKTRYNIVKQVKSQKLKVKSSDDIENFIKLYHRWHRKRLLFLSQSTQIRNLYNAFGNNAYIFFATIDNEIISELLTINYDSLSYYMFAASSSLGKKLFAPTLVTWEAIKDAKKRGCKIFDFEGIYDERFPLKSWIGFSRFKKSFGGKEIEYPGCFIKTNFLNIIKQ